MRANTQCLMPRKLKMFKQDEARGDFGCAHMGYMQAIKIIEQRSIATTFLILEVLNGNSMVPRSHDPSPQKAEETMEFMDIVIEVLDARVPEASHNPVINEMRLFRQRPNLKILNKSDLADPKATEAWLNYFNRQPNTKAVALSCKKRVKPIKFLNIV